MNLIRSITLGRPSFCRQALENSARLLMSARFARDGARHRESFRGAAFMRRSITMLAVAVVLLLGAPAFAAPDQQEVIDRAKATLEGLRGDASYGNAPELLKRAKAVM